MRKFWKQSKSFQKKFRDKSIVEWLSFWLIVYFHVDFGHVLRCFCKSFPMVYKVSSDGGKQFWILEKIYVSLLYARKC